MKANELQINNFLQTPNKFGFTQTHANPSATPKEPFVSTHFLAPRKY